MRPEAATSRRGKEAQLVHRETFTPRCGDHATCVALVQHFKRDPARGVNIIAAVARLVEKELRDGPPGKGAAFGTITAQSVTGTAGTVLELSISAPVAAGTQLGWAVFTGPCGSPTPPLAGPHEFPTIEISNSGGARLKAAMSFALDPRTAYHANVYWAARVSDVSNVMMCAPLTIAGR